ncbi:unnamed protein product, partial [Allacma fusca]
TVLSKWPSLRMLNRGHDKEML